METKKRFKLGITGIFIFLTILSMGLVLGAGASTLDSPIQYGNYTSTINVSCTSIVNSAEVDHNVTFYYNASGGNADVDATNLATILNTSASQIVFESETESLSGLTAGTGYNFSCYADNGTDQVYSTSADNIIIYTSTPSCSFLVDRESINWMDYLGVNPTSTSTVDALTSITYSWTLYDPDLNSVTSSSSSAPSFTNSDFEDIGEHILSLVVSDDFGNSNACSNVSIFVTGKDGDVAITQSIISDITTGKASARIYWIIGGIFGIIIMGVVAFYILNIMKKRR